MSTVAYPVSSRRQFRRYAFPLFFVAAFFYFLFHSFSGDRGLYALVKEQRKLKVVEAELEQVTAKRNELEHRVKLLNPSSLDYDLLDEQARHVLGMAGENEVIYYPSQK